MYVINSEGERLIYCEAPRYIKVNPNSGCFVQAEEDDAQGVAVMGNPFNLPGHTEIMRDVFIPTEGGEEGEGTVERQVAPEAEVQRVDNYEFLMGLEDTGIETEDAICELSVEYANRLATVEDAVCELTKGE